MPSILKQLGRFASTPHRRPLFPIEFVPFFFILVKEGLADAAERVSGASSKRPDFSEFLRPLSPLKSASPLSGPCERAARKYTDLSVLVLRMGVCIFLFYGCINYCEQKYMGLSMSLYKIIL